MSNRTVLLICLDSAMLLLVGVLECLALTGLVFHEWLGFALCLLVLLHVTMQWPWFANQFQRMRTPGAYRVRANAFLNLALFVMMAVVLVSGVLASRQATFLMGEAFGRVRIWREIHGGLNFIVVILVALHLALNWDWIIAALRRRRPERPTPAETASGNSPAPGGRRGPAFANSIPRALSVLFLATVAAGALYFVTLALTPSKKPAAQQTHAIAAAAPAVRSPPKQLAPRPRRASLPHGVEQLLVTAAAMGFTTLLGRFVFRLRL